VDEISTWRIPLEPNVRNDWTVGERMQLMLDLNRSVDYEVVEITEGYLVVAKVEDLKRAEKQTRSRPWPPWRRPASHRGRPSPLAEP
jgi:hypothetical protein